MRVNRPTRFTLSQSPVVLHRVKAPARAREREHFLAVAGRLARATGEAGLEALHEELARLTFGS